MPHRCGGRVSDSDLRCEYSISGKRARLLGPCDLLHAINDRIYNCFSRKRRHGVISSSFTRRHISSSSSSVCVHIPSAMCIRFILTSSLRKLKATLNVFAINARRTFWPNAMFAARRTCSIHFDKRVLANRSGCRDSIVLLRVSMFECRLMNRDWEKSKFRNLPLHYLICQEVKRTLLCKAPPTHNATTAKTR